LLQIVISGHVRCGDPDPRHHSLLYPGSILFTEQPNVDQIVQDLTRFDVAVPVSMISVAKGFRVPMFLESVNMMYDRLEVCIIENNSPYHAQKH
jgi:hypothetical protein